VSFSVSLEELYDRSLRRADLTPDSFRDANEVKAVIRANYRAAYRLLCDADDDYNVASEDIFTGSGDVYPLPGTFFKLRKVEAWSGGTAVGDAVKVSKWRLDQVGSYSWAGTGPVGYRLQGDNIRLSPAPSSGTLVRLWYTPAPADLADDADTIDAVTGMDELIVTGAARDLMIEEGDPEAVAILRDEYADKRAEFLSGIQGRAEPEQAADVILDPEMWP